MRRCRGRVPVFSPVDRVPQDDAVLRAVSSEDQVLQLAVDAAQPAGQDQRSQLLLVVVLFADSSDEVFRDGRLRLLADLPSVKAELLGEL